MPRRAAARGSTPRKRIARLRHEIAAYSVPRQGVRRRRTQAEAAAEWAGAQQALRYRAARRAESARPLKKKRPWWSWLIMDYNGFQQDRQRRR